MKKVIENIRNKPEHHRDRIVWIVAAIATVILLALWAIVGNGGKRNSEENFFQNFTEGVNEGKDILPANINAN